MARRVSAEPLLVLLLASMPAAALEMLDESALAGVSAQDGLLLEMAQQRPHQRQSFHVVYRCGAAPAGSCSGGIADRHACTLLAPQLSGVGGNLRSSLTLDVGGNGSLPAVAMDLNWQPLLLQSSLFSLNTPTTDYSSQTLGQLGIYSSGYFRLANEGGIFNSSGNTARYAFSTVGDIIYRQGAVGTPELSFGNFELSTKFSNGAGGGQLAGNGTIGLDAQGLLIAAPYTDTRLQFDLMYHGSPATAFDRNNRQGILRFGWLGGLRDARMRISSGGVGYGSYNSNTQNLLSGSSFSFQNDTGSSGNPRSEGLNLLAQWDFDSDFALVIGQASGSNETQARFSNWRRMATLPASTPMLTMPVILDVVQNATGPRGLCMGGGFTSGMPTQAACASAGGNWIAGGVPAGQAALAALIRDGRLHAYSQQVNVIDPDSPNPYSTYNWGIVNTMGKLDADMFFYPEGRNSGVAVSTNGTGMKADITLAIQSPGFWNRANSSDPVTRAAARANWATNSHFMVADTAVGGNTALQYGVGFVNADLLWSVRNLYFRLVGSDAGYPQSRAACGCRRTTAHASRCAACSAAATCSISRIRSVSACSTSTSPPPASSSRCTPTR